MADTMEVLVCENKIETENNAVVSLTDSSFLELTKQDIETSSSNELDSSLIDAVIDDCASPTLGGETSIEIEDSSLDGCSDDGTYTDSIDASDIDEDEDDVDEFLDAGDDVAEAGEHDHWINERRHSGDGEEQPEKIADLRKLDDDQDKQNPAYVPRTGSFFEHDLRRDDDDDDRNKSQEKDSKNAPKKLWLETKKWQHDRFDERSQAPKSREEIVAVYGFDIRDGEARARNRIQSGKKTKTGRRSEGVELGDYLAAPIERADQENEKVPVSVVPSVAEVDSPQSVNSGHNMSEVHKVVPRVLAGPSSRVGRRGRLPERQRDSANHPSTSAGVGINSNMRTVRNSEETHRRRRNSGSRVSSAVPSEGSQFSTHRIVHTRKSGGGLVSSHPSRLSRTIITNDGSLVSRNASSRFSGTSEIKTASGTASLAVSTDSQDARHSFPDLPSMFTPVTSIAGTDKRSDRKSTLIVHTTMAPEIIPPMTRVVTYARASKPVKSKSGNHVTVTSSENDSTSVVPSTGWTGGDFTPAACRPLPTHVSPSIVSSNCNRSKRYSSQRLRNALEGGSLDAENHDGPLPVTSVTHSNCVVTSVLPLQSRPIPVTAYFANPTGQIPLFAGHGPRMVGGQPLLHSTFMTRTGPVPMLPPNSFVGPPPIIGYRPSVVSPTGPNFVPMPFASVPIGEVGSNPLEVRGGTVYFSTETQKPSPDLRGGTIYFDPGQQVAASNGPRSPARRPKVAIPIINPQDLEVKQSGKPEQAIESSEELSQSGEPEQAVESSQELRQPGEPEQAIESSSELKQSEEPEQAVKSFEEELRPSGEPERAAESSEKVKQSGKPEQAVNFSENEVVDDASEVQSSASESRNVPVDS